MNNPLPRHKFVGVKVSTTENRNYESYWLSDISELNKVRHLKRFDCIKVAIEEYFKEPSEWMTIRFSDTEVIAKAVKKHEYDYICYRAHEKCDESENME